MSKVHAVLLVPEPGDPHGLLAEGPCGARPPMAYISNRGWKWTEGPCAEEYPNGRALVLAWGGEPVWQGAVWAEGVLAALDCDETPSWRLLVNRVDCVLLPTRLSMKMLRRLVGDLGTLILLDAEVREVNDE